MTTQAQLIDRLRRRVQRLEARVRELGGRRASRTISFAEHAARAVRCHECGAERGEPCRYPNDQARPAHHLRGRTAHCGKAKCSACRGWFR